MSPSNLVSPPRQSSSYQAPPSNQRLNQLLASLPAEEFERLSSHLSSFPLKLGEVLAEQSQQVQQVYFVEEGLVSYVLRPQAGFPVEVGLVGSEGVGGAEAALAQEPAPFQIMVQAVGQAQAMAAEAFRSEVRRGGVLYAGVMRHQRLLALQAAQAALCNRQHTTEERLSRWLLMVHDRVPKEVLELKGSFLSMMLGSRESGVFFAATMLRRAGFIDFNEESVTLLDRRGLEAMSCECYGALRHTSTLNAPLASASEVSTASA